MAPLTALPLVNNLPKKKVTNQAAAERCRAQGGKWDFAKQRCILPTSKAPVSIPDPQTQSKAPTKPVPNSQLPDRTITSPDGSQRVQTIEETRRLQGEREFRAGLPEELTAAGRIETAKQAALTEEEIQAQILEEPERRELDPTRTELEKVPVVGAMLQLARNFLKDKAGLELEDATQIKPEELRTEVLTEIERREIEAGLTASEEFGRLVESINVGQISKWIPGLSSAEKPSENVQTIVTGLRQLKTRARDIVSNAETGDLTRSQAEERIRVIERELQVGESRIRLLVQNSPDLKFNSDGVNFIEGKILETRIILQDAKIAAIRGQVAAPSTDASVIARANDLQSENFNIPGLSW